MHSFASALLRLFVDAQGMSTVASSESGHSSSAGDSAPVYSALFAFPRMFSLYACVPPVASAVKLWDYVRPYTLAFSFACVFKGGLCITDAGQRAVHACIDGCGGYRTAT